MVTKFRSAWAIVLTSTNNYIKGVITMKHAMHKHNSRYPILVLYTSQVSPEIIDILKRIGCLVKMIDSIHPLGKVEYKFKRFEETWTKLAVWNEIEYERLVLLDADMLPLKNMDELMEMDLPQGWIAASYACTCNPQKISHYPPHWVPENCAYTGCADAQPPSISDRANYFNSGLIVLSPDRDKYRQMISYLDSIKDLNIYPFPDQDFLNEIFKGHWMPISYAYNALKTLQWAHEPMWDIKYVKNIHYILTKPWDISEDEEWADLELIYKPLYKIWWKSYSEVDALVDTKKLEQLLTG
ncbi:hypothetical protein G6F16_008555 [Rhizopus arrhizus]|nr:hypothetical protein G6F22_007183 [Rhizopus arrhizus]KAG0828830.1 hypothetical protein G6F19_008056 [Rhizopus arrhizus]KAG0829588.1 hypothetical protein G6F18_008533 [Rhizopus arrhizus]KAG0849549.1 hypothetical protein G6F17_010669 [Rhizopus arrhizus]KAG0867746.1 hypothetical protein G6F16_008555 [Rhizopus arrhizus]